MYWIVMFIYGCVWYSPSTVPVPPLPAHFHKTTSVLYGIVRFIYCCAWYNLSTAPPLQTLPVPPFPAHFHKNTSALYGNIVPFYIWLCLIQPFKCPPLQTVPVPPLPAQFHKTTLALYGRVLKMFSMFHHHVSVYSLMCAVVVTGFDDRRD